MRESGPVLRVSLRPPPSRIAYLVGAGRPPPTPVSGLALVDTGADATCVDRRVAERARLGFVGETRMTSATHDGEIVPLYSGRLAIDGLARDIELETICGLNLEPQGLVAVIGRDILEECVLVYNGPDGSFSLSI